MSEVWSLSEGKRTWRLRAPTSEFDPERLIARFAEEYGFLDLARSNTRPNVGDVVRIVPNHVCVVVNMMDEVVMVRGEEIVGTLPVAARGKLR